MAYLLTIIAITSFNWGAVSVKHPVDRSVINVANVLHLTNEDRVKAGLQGLNESKYLDSLAQSRASDEATHENFSHIDSHGKRAYEEVNISIYPYKDFGENLAIMFMDAQSEEAAFMQSPEHRDNILNPSYKDIGIAVEEGKYGNATTTYVTIEFGDD